MALNLVLVGIIKVIKTTLKLISEALHPTDHLFDVLEILRS